MSETQTNADVYFKTEIIDSVAVIRLQEKSFEITTDLEPSQMFVSTLASLNNDPKVIGLTLIKDQAYQEDAAVKAFLAKIAKEDSSNYESTQDLSRYINISESITRAINDFSKPLVAGIKGNITLEYLAFILPFDFRLASESTVSVFPNLKFGVPPSGNLVYQLQRYLSPGKVMEILISNQPISAKQLVELDLISKLTDDYSLLEDSVNKVRELSSLPPFVLTAIRKALSPTPGEYTRYMERAREINRFVIAHITTKTRT